MTKTQKPPLTLAQKCNRRRALKIEKLLRSIYDECSVMENVTDALTDLRHLCARKNWDFFRCDRIARDHYAVESFSTDNRAPSP